MKAKLRSNKTNLPEGASLSNNLIKIASWNLNGLRSCLRQSSLLEFAGRLDLDIFCINEHRLQEKMLPKFKEMFTQFPYQYWSCSQVKKGYSGVAILSKEEPISVIYGLGKPIHDQEGRVLTAEFSSFYVVSTYVPSLGMNNEKLNYRTQEWDVDLRNHLKSLEAQGKGVIWIGDLNIVIDKIDHYKKNQSCTPEEKEQFEITLDEGFVDSFRYLYPHTRKYSWFSQKQPGSKDRNEGWRLDYAIVSAALVPCVQDSLIHNDVEGSDHSPVELVLQMSSD